MDYETCYEGKENDRHVLGMLLVLRAPWPYRKVTFSDATSKIMIIIIIKKLASP